MRPTTVRLSAAGFSDWIPINRMSESFGVGLGVVLSSGAVLTYSVQHTFDQLFTPTYNWSASRVTTTGTITKTNHGLSVNSWVKFDAAAPFNAAYAVAGITDANIFTVTVANSGITVVGPGASNLWSARVFEHDDLTVKTASADGNYAFPPVACRLIISAYTSGFADLTVVSAG